MWAGIPNQRILINTLVLQEAKASSEVESYVTTQDGLFQADLHIAEWVSSASKEVSRYREALMHGFERMRRQQNLLTSATLVSLFQLLKNSQESFRSGPGTVLKNEKTGEIVFVPPQDAASIVAHMQGLELFINDEHQSLLDTPILYLSRYLNRHKGEYYRLLQAVRDENNAETAWQAWVKFILSAVAETAQRAVQLVRSMRELMADTKRRLREDTPKLYSQDLLNNLFRHPYTRIEFVQDDLGVTRQTAARYLRQLADAGLVQPHSRGRHLYFINVPLVELLAQGEY